jgi:uncharacterized protein with PIN domain
MSAITEYDRCPACGKKLANTLKEQGGILRDKNTGVCVCMKCGCHFTPRSQVQEMIRQAKSPIIQPGSAQGRMVKS